MSNGNSNNGKNSGKKNILSPSIINGTSSVNYRSLSSISSSSSDQPIYRGLSQISNTSLSSSFTDAGKGLVAAQQAKQSLNSSLSPNPNTAILIDQNIEQAALKAAKAASSSVHTLSTDEKLKASTEEVFVAKDFPIAGFPLSQSYVVVNDPTKLDPAMKSISKSLKGQDKPAKGCIKAQLENDTEVKVSAYRDATTGKCYIEFNRLDGCAFTFQKAFLKAKLDAAPFLDGADLTEIQTEIQLIERKLSFWYGKENNAVLLSLLPSNSANA